MRVALLLPLASAGGAAGMTLSTGFWLWWRWMNGVTKVPFCGCSGNGVCLLPVGWWMRRRLLVWFELHRELVPQLDAEVPVTTLDPCQLPMQAVTVIQGVLGLKQRCVKR